MPTGDPMCSACGSYVNLCQCIRVPIIPGRYSFTPNATFENQELKSKVAALENQVSDLQKRLDDLEKYIKKQIERNTPRKKDFTGKKK